MDTQAFEVWEDPSGKIRFCYSYVSPGFSTGALIMQPGAKIPKHNRQLAIENLLQVSGRCTMTLFASEAGDAPEEHTLELYRPFKVEAGRWHTHANPFEEVSITLFKGEGDITAAVKAVRKTFTRIV